LKFIKKKEIEISQTNYSHIVRGVNLTNGPWVSINSFL